MSRIEDIFQEIQDKELVSILGEYLTKNIGDDEYEWKETQDNIPEYLVGSKSFLKICYNGTFYYLWGIFAARGEKKPDIEPVVIKGIFSVETSDDNSHSEIRKSFWNGKQAVYEQYIPDQKNIMAKVYTTKTVNEYSRLRAYYNSKNELTPKKLHVRDIPDMVKFMSADGETIIATEISSGEFMLYDANNNPPCFYIEGESLYDAYYNYMVEKGYFSDDDQKTGRRTRG